MGFNKNQLQQIAMALKQEHPGKDIALAHPTGGNTIYLASHDTTNAHYPTSAIVELIQALNQHGTQGYIDKVLWNGATIHHTAAANTMDTAMAEMNKIKLEKLTAKPLPDEYQIPAQATCIPVQSDRWIPQSPLLSFADVTGGPAPSVVLGGGKAQGAHTLDRLYMMAVFALVTSRFVRKYQGHQNANIGALLVSRVGKILAWSVNTKEHNSTYHAEVNLLQGCFFNSPGISFEGARLYTSLKPCRMCAGMIHHVGKEKVHVLYGQGDPGADAQATVLDGTGKLHPLDETAAATKKVMAILKTTTGDSPKIDLLKRLEEERDNVKHQGTIGQTLSLPGSKELMRGAVRSLGTKFAKYQTANSAADTLSMSSVRQVLAHIEPFLRQHGAHPTQIADVSDYLYGNPDAVGYTD